ncbi:hypothetical protein LIER_41465 [Lithospermum erythrorhizon]|uniref:Uncharacterized protein n=1 Tax=Lithospermum erythrorhizon TaxID=34254 RepID=A0AAV3RDW1_LITER
MELLRRRSRWCMGNGHTVKIWQDSWVSNDEAARLLSPPLTGFENARVVLLMDVHNRRWDTDLIQQLFFPFEADLILALPFLDIEGRI